MIAEFFENQEIFITGGSGVVGKALIEKLLRSCNVAKIYILLRPKKNLSVEERLENLKKSTLFDQLKLNKPDELNDKLIPIPGDCRSSCLGITAEYQKIMEKVSIVFHSAATVRFDEALKDAIKLNVGGTLEAIKFAKTLNHLKVFMHISTFFSNPYLRYIEEKLYESPMDWKFCLNLIETNDISYEHLDILTRKLIIGFPNTYCFTKNLAESLVNDYRHELPIAIFRPSIFLMALEEPEPGFPTSLTGAMGLFALTGAGLLKTIYMNQNNRLDFIPQDIGIKCLCYYTYKTAHLYANNKLDAIPIYIASSCTHNDISFKQFIKMSNTFWTEAAYEKNLLIPNLYCTDNRLVYYVLILLKQILPALLIDFVLILSGRKPILMSIQRRGFITLEVMKPFLFNTYYCAGTTDYSLLFESVKGTEFNLDLVPELMNYFKNLEIVYTMVYSVRKHLLKEDPKTLPRSREIMKVKFFVYNAITFLIAFKSYEKVMEYLQFNYFENKLDAGNSTFCLDII